jgi:hypothetical protein
MWHIDARVHRHESGGMWSWVVSGESRRVRRPTSDKDSKDKDTGRREKKIKKSDVSK